jgi:uncharacterized protein (DUF1778 family)
MHHEENKKWLDEAEPQAFMDLDKFTLSEADFDFIMEIIKNPPKPTQFLVDLMRGSDKIEK